MIWKDLGSVVWRMFFEIIFWIVRNYFCFFGEILDDDSIFGFFIYF